MPLNSSGTISIGGSTSGQSVNLELGRGASASTNLNESVVRNNLAGLASGTISLANLYGGVYVHSTMSGLDSLYSDLNFSTTGRTELYVYRNGTWGVFTTSAGSDSGNWAVAPVASSGDTIYVQFAIVTVHIGGWTWSPTSGVLLLNTTRQIQVEAISGTQTQVTYRVDLFKDAAGTRLLSRSFVRLEAEAL